MLRTSERPPELSESPATRSPGRAGELRAAAVLAGLVLVSTGLRFWAGLAVPGPWFTPDEIVYGELGRSLYGLGRFEILGATPDFYGLVYPALVGLPLSLSDRELGYELLKALQAVVMSLAAVPVYLWGRSLMRRRWALTAAVLSLALPALAFSGFVMTEVAFYPVLTLAAWAMAAALVRPTPARQALVVAAVVLAAMTRLQAVVLAPAFLLAVGLKVAFDRSWLRGARPFAPALAGFLGLATVWAAVTRASGGQPLGAYSITREASYELWDAARFVLYHAADVLLLTAVLPAAAVALLAVPAVRGRERSSEAQAYLAVTIAVSLAFVAAVGVFASRWLERLAERNLIGLAPLLFLGFALWLDRGAPRPRVATALVSAAAVGLLLFAPWGELVTEAARPDAFSVIPLRRLELWNSGLEPGVLVVVGALELLALLVLLPRRLAWVLPLTLLVLLGSASVPVSVEIAGDARAFNRALLGADSTWIDRAADGPVSYVFGGEQSWSAGAPVWMHLFWNGRVERLYNLFGARVAGPIPRTTVRPAADGRLLGQNGRPAEGSYAVASTRLTFVGERLAATEAQLALWRLEPPLRLATRRSGIDGTGVIEKSASLVVYDCRGGELRLMLRSPADQTVELVRDGTAVRTVPLEVDRPWAGSIRAPRPRGALAHACRFAIRGLERPLRAERLDFVRAP